MLTKEEKNIEGLSSSQKSLKLVKNNSVDMLKELGLTPPTDKKLKYWIKRSIKSDALSNTNFNSVKRSSGQEDNYK